MVGVALLPLGAIISGLIILFSVFLMFYRNSIRGFYAIISSGKSDVKGGVYSLTMILIGGIIIVIGIALLLSSVFSPNLIQVLIDLGAIIGGTGFIITSIGFIILGLDYSNLGRVYSNGGINVSGRMISIAHVLFLASFGVILVTSPTFTTIINGINNLTTNLLGIFIGVLMSSIGYALDIIGFLKLYSNLRVSSVSVPVSQVSSMPQQNVVVQQTNIPQVKQQDNISQPNQQTVTEQPPQNSGTLNRDGTANLIVYSQYPLQILSASLSGVGVITNDVNPNQLKVGVNYVTVNFRTPLSLSQEEKYTISLALSNGQIMSVEVTYKS